MTAEQDPNQKAIFVHMAPPLNTTTTTIQALTPQVTPPSTQESISPIMNVSYPIPIDATQSSGAQLVQHVQAQPVYEDTFQPQTASQNRKLDSLRDEIGHIYSRVTKQEVDTYQIQEKMVEHETSLKKLEECTGKTRVDIIDLEAHVTVQDQQFSAQEEQIKVLQKQVSELYRQASSQSSDSNEGKVKGP